MLDQRFFERFQSTPHKNSTLEAYKAVYARSTLVLFSRKTRTPMAALTLRARDVGCLGMLTGRPSPKNASEPYFQGMLNMPDQAFTFTISNLSDQGMVNFNILHTPYRVSQVDPGPSYGINQVNELHANQSYTIEADQRNNRRMILSGKTKIVKDPTTNQDKEVQVTVKETETSETDKGLYFNLSVVPDKTCKSLVDKFAEGTVWKVVPGFVRRVARAPPPPMGGYRGGGGRATGIPRINMASTRRELYSSLPSLGSHAFSQDVYFEPDPPAARPSGSISRDVHSARGPPSLGSGSCATEASGGFIGDDEVRDELPMGSHQGGSRVADIPRSIVVSARRGLSPLGSRRVPPSVSRSSGAPLTDFIAARRGPPAVSLSVGSSALIDQPTRAAGGVATRPSPSHRSAPRSLAENVDVGSTQAGKLSYGQHVDVLSSYTGHDYAYEHASEPTVLCMSIWEAMKFLPLADTIEQDLDAEIKEWVENEGKALIESLNAVFKSDTCVIDLESEADTIVCTCGHQCINHSNTKNLRNCPMCRQRIAAFVRADGLLLE